MTEPRVTQEQLDLMRHTAGLDRRKTPYRNHFSADDGHLEWNNLNDLVDMGLMTKHQPPLNDSMTMFHLTDQGCWMLGLSGTDAITA